MCGSTSVACCPGPTEYGSELTCVRFAPTGFPGCVTVVVGGVEELEHPRNHTINKESTEATAVLGQGTSNTVLIIWKTEPQLALRHEEAADSMIGGFSAHVNYYFLLPRSPGGTTPFSGCSFSIFSESLCRGLSPLEDNTAGSAGAVNPCAVNIASLEVEPDFAAATAKTPCATPLLNAVAM